MRNFLRIFLAILLFYSGIPATGQTVRPYFSLLSSNVGTAVDVVADPVNSSRLFIVQQPGVIKIFNGTSVLASQFLNVSAIITSGGERGLLSMAFHPNYATNGYFFVLYTDLNGDLTLARYQRFGTNADSADAASGVVLKTIPHPTYANHNGGKLLFGTDGNLYWSTGDGGGGGDPANNAQNGNSLLGKILRYNVDNFTTAPYYTIPATNPYVADPNIADDIWAVGLRNPFRWSFDKLNGDMWIADVGQNNLEEVNVVPGTSTGGRNYGWKCYEGTQIYTTPCTPLFSPLVSPVFEYGHNMTTGGYSITGGYVYRGTQFPNLYGKYICADYVSGNVWLLTPSGSTYTSQIYDTLPGSITAFGEKADGSLYAVSLNGNLYQVVDNTVLSLNWLSFNYSISNGSLELRWRVLEKDAAHYDVEWSADGRDFQQIGTVAARNEKGESEYSYLIPEYNRGQYRIKMTSLNGEQYYSGTLTIGDETNTPGIAITPNLISDDMLQVQSNKAIDHFSVYDITGKRLFAHTRTLQPGLHRISLPQLSTGTYYVKFLSSGETTTSKIFID